VDPLEVASDLSEGVDPGLIDHHPIADTNLLADQSSKLLDAEPDRHC
jgi:hypothetical protein